MVHLNISAQLDEQDSNTWSIRGLEDLSPCWELLNSQFDSNELTVAMTFSVFSLTASKSTCSSWPKMSTRHLLQVPFLINLLGRPYFLTAGIISLRTWLLECSHCTTPGVINQPFERKEKHFNVNKSTLKCGKECDAFSIAKCFQFTGSGYYLMFIVYLFI